MSPESSDQMRLLVQVNEKVALYECPETPLLSGKGPFLTLRILLNFSLPS
ncbi:hypothetical protein VULLAG_LOCUS11270 [Vulpes lagopus]